MSDQLPERVRWRDAETGRVRSGFLSNEQPGPSTYRVGVPDWSRGDVAWITIPRERALVGNTPWPNDW